MNSDDKRSASLFLSAGRIALLCAGVYQLTIQPFTALSSTLMVFMAYVFMIQLFVIVSALRDLSSAEDEVVRLGRKVNQLEYELADEKRIAEEAERAALRKRVAELERESDKDHDESGASSFERFDEADQRIYDLELYHQNFMEALTQIESTDSITIFSMRDTWRELREKNLVVLNAEEGDRSDDTGSVRSES